MLSLKIECLRAFPSFSEPSLFTIYLSSSNGNQADCVSTMWKYTRMPSLLQWIFPRNFQDSAIMLSSKFHWMCEFNSIFNCWIDFPIGYYWNWIIPFCMWFHPQSLCIQFNCSAQAIRRAVGIWNFTLFKFIIPEISSKLAIDLNHFGVCNLIGSNWILNVNHNKVVFPSVTLISYAKGSKNFNVLCNFFPAHILRLPFSCICGF